MLAATTESDGSQATARSSVAGRIQTVVLDSAKTQARATIAFGYTTTVYMPLPCTSAEAGQPRDFHVFRKKGETSRFMIAPRINQLETSSNITVTCEDGVALLLIVNVGPPEKSVNVIDVVFDKDYDARVIAAVKRTEAEAANRCGSRDETADELARTQQMREILQGMSRRVAFMDDVEYARQDFVIARVFRQIVIDQTYFITFSVQNRTDNEITIGGVDVIDESTEASASGIVLAQRDFRIEPQRKVDITVKFDAPMNGANTFRLVILEDGPRELVVDDIEF